MRKLLLSAVAIVGLLSSTNAFAQCGKLSGEAWSKCIHEQDRKMFGPAIDAMKETLKNSNNPNPEHILKTAYTNYITVKVCYEHRKGYEYIWISDPEVVKAREYVATIEGKLNLPNREEIWKSIDPQRIESFLVLSETTNGLGRGGERLYCQGALSSLRSQYDTIVGPQPLKKDF